MPLKLIGKACPINVPNCYQETMLPGALDEFLATPEARNVPMGIMHECQIGYWNELHLRDGWLHCCGVVDCREIEYAIRAGAFNELSVCYEDVECANANSLARNAEEQQAALSHTRRGRQLDAAAKALSEMPQEDARTIMLAMHILPERDSILDRLSRPFLTERRLHRAGLAEISVVDKGAFDNCTYQWQAI